RLLIVSAPDDAVVLTPPQPPTHSIVDVPAAVREALRFPLDGPALDRVVTRGAHVTVVVEQASLPLPGAPVDPRRQAIETTVAESRLQTGGSGGWGLAVALERQRAARVPVIGLSLALDRLRVAEAADGYPSGPASLERIVRSPFTRLFRLLPGPVRMRALRSLPVGLGTSAAFAGRPSVAHAEALLRAVELRSAKLDRPLDAI